MWLGPPCAHRDPGSFRAATRKERTCFAAECGPDPFGHTRALQGPFFDPKTQNPKQGVPKGLEQPHEKKGGDLEIGTWPRQKRTIYEQNLVLQNQPYFSRFMEGEAEFRAATRKEQLCFAAECGLGRLGHTGTPNGLEQPHEQNGPVLLQNVAPTPFGHTRALQDPFFDPKTQNPKARSPEGFRAATRKERRGPRDWHLAQAKMHIL